MLNKIIIGIFLLFFVIFTSLSAMDIETDTIHHSLQATIETQNPEKKRLVHNLWVINQVILDLFGGQFPKDIREIISGYELLFREPIYAACLSPKNLEDLMVNMIWRPSFNRNFIGEMNIIMEGFEFGKVYFFPFEVDLNKLIVRENKETIKLKEIRLQSGSGTSITYTFVSDYGTYRFFPTPLDDLGNHLDMSNVCFEPIKTEKAKGILKQFDTSDPNLILIKYFDSYIGRNVDIYSEDLIIKFVKRTKKSALSE